MYLAQTAYDTEQTARAAFTPATAMGGATLSAPARIQDSGPLLHQLAKTIQLMRLEHADAHLYRHGCDALVRHVVGVADRPNMESALAAVMRRVELGDYHGALLELRALAQSEWHAC